MTDDALSSGDDTREILEDLVRSSGSLTALLVTKQGSVVCDAGDTGYLNITAMAALVAGMFSATREVARMVGECEFSILLQQGTTRHIHISLVNEDTMMVIVFEDYRRIGQVRHKAREAGVRLERQLRADHSAAQDAGIAVPVFREYALNLIDRIFQS